MGFVTFEPKVSSAWIVGVIAMSGVANAGPYVEHSSVTESLREIELAVSDATSSDPRDYVLQDGDQYRWNMNSHDSSGWGGFFKARAVL